MPESDKSNEPEETKAAEPVDETAPIANGDGEEAAPEAVEINDFAESVMMGLAEVGIEIKQGFIKKPAAVEKRFSARERAPAVNEAPPLRTASAVEHVESEEPTLSVDEIEEAFFAGWDGVELPPESENATAGGFAEPSGASGAHRLASGASIRELAEDFDVSKKHDALADAVQAALSSVYGSSANHMGAPHNIEAEHFQTYQPQTHTSRRIDGLSPEDVILNYFDYEQSLSASQVPAGIEPRGSGNYDIGYEGPPTYGVPAARDAAVGRESGRLLGAAGIGLVVGIAIATVAAVFILNMNDTPAFRTASQGGGAKADASRSAQSDTALRNFFGNSNPRQEAAIAPAQNESAINQRAAATAKPSEKPAEAANAVAAAANISVADVSASAGQSVALPIAWQSQGPSDQALVSITGIPQGGRLNVGVDTGEGNWLVPPRRLNGLALTVPANAQDAIQLEAQLLDKNNIRTPLSEKKKFVIRIKSDASTTAQAEKAGDRATALASFSTETMPAAPAQQNATDSARAAQSPAFRTETVQAAKGPSPASARDRKVALATANSSSDQPTALKAQVDSEDLIQEGNRLMQNGDILEARERYDRASKLGNVEALLAMGRSYDPIYFARLQKKNAEPDSQKALEWYQKALDSGASQTALLRIENLRHFLNE